MPTLIAGTVLLGILSDPEWSRRFRSAVTFEEALEVIKAYIREKHLIEKFRAEREREEREEKPKAKVWAYLCPVEYEIYEFTEKPAEPPKCPIHNVPLEFLEAFEE